LNKLLLFKDDPEVIDQLRSLLGFKHLERNSRGNILTEHTVRLENFISKKVQTKSFVNILLSFRFHYRLNTKILIRLFDTATKNVFSVPTSKNIESFSWEMQQILFYDIPENLLSSLSFEFKVSILIMLSEEKYYFKPIAISLFQLSEISCHNSEFNLVFYQYKFGQQMIVLLYLAALILQI
jgi:hypothetical protein